MSGHKGVINLKIEKINDSQIKCTLTDDDLKTRRISPSELAYGSEKTRNLFREMLSQAAKDLGFSVENMPLMIEAVPMENSALVVLITKVSDPEEVDTRFAKFTPADSCADDTGDPSDPPRLKGADDVLDTLLQAQNDACAASGKAEDGQENAPAADTADFYMAWHFDNIDGACRAAHAIQGQYEEENSLYNDPDDPDACILVMHKGKQSPEDFNRLCNILTEYGTPVRMYAAESRLIEHAKVICAHQAVQKIKDL